MNDISKINMKLFCVKPVFKLCPKHSLKLHKYALIDGQKVELANYTMEPTHIFMGKGNHPLRGTVKFEKSLKDVVINVSKNACLDHNKYKSVIHNNNVSWLAYYVDSMGCKKYLYKKICKENEIEKFEFARLLKKKLCHIRKINENNLHSDSLKKQQLACCLWLIDRLSLRIGNEKDSNNQADTYGVCTLLVSHLKIKENKIILDFLGKDSIRCKKSSVVCEKVKNVLQICTKNKKSDQQIFDHIDANHLNRYLNKMLPGLTAKVFRTCNASRRFCSLLNSFDNTSDPIDFYKNANIQIAKLCNHKNGTRLSMITSKQNYIDPRITVSFCKRFNIDLIKCFSESLIQKHSWALHTDANFVF
jgi:DNA topoisomerase-1